MQQYLEKRPPYILLKWLTTGMALVYAVFFFARLIRNYETLRALGLDPDLAVPGNPQSMIALCFFMLALAIWLLRGKLKVAAVSLLYVALIGYFLYWAWLTTQIKSAIGRPAIPRTGRLENVWIGSTVLDPIVLVGSAAMLVLSVTLLFTMTGSKDTRASMGRGLANSQPHI